jgi:hypothetical protein
MSAQTNIVAFDGAATPVVHTLVASGVKALSKDQLVAEWQEKLPTVPDMAQVRATLTESLLKSGKTRNALVVDVPIMESISGANSSGYTAAPKVALVETVHIISYSDPRSTIATKRLARQLALNVAGSISTTVTPVVTGPVPELLDQGIFPS